MRRKITALSAGLKNEKLRELFLKCFFSTLDSTVLESEGMPFVFTGDIPAMWLRDSSAQVLHYLPFAREDKEVACFVRGLIRRQLTFFMTDPYANAFNAEANGRGHHGDIVDKYNPWVWERKWEIDSPCYIFWLIEQYVAVTDDFSVFDEDYFKAAELLLHLFKIEQNPETSSYIHKRYGNGAHISDTLINNGRGGKCRYTGLVRSAYRPSDDACRYGFFIPGNMFAVVALRSIGRVARHEKQELAKKAVALCEEIEKGIREYGIIEEDGETFFAYEVDGLGNSLFMDDANVPSLLAAPLIGFCKNDDELYLRTRKRVLSYRNPFYFEGKYAKGIGSPHTPDGYVWHIGLCVQALTSNNEKEIQEIINTLCSTDADTGQMHEGFNADNPSEYTRPWFAWANSMFALCIMKKVLKWE